MAPSLLIVDDQQDILHIVALTFSTMGYQVTTARSGAEALEKASHIAIDLALVDWQMPGMDGIAVCRALLAEAGTRSHPLAVWLMTGAPPSTVATQAAAAGCLGVFEKPLNIGRVMAELHAHESHRPSQA